MADGRHREKSKIGHISAKDRPIGTKFDFVTHIGPPNQTGSKNFNCSKSKMADSRHFEKSENGHISATVHAINTKFGTLMHICTANRSNIQLLKIQDGGRRHLKKLKNGHDSARPPRFDRSALDLA